MARFFTWRVQLSTFWWFGLSGVVGGLTSVQGPPIMMWVSIYAAELNVDSWRGSNAVLRVLLNLTRLAIFGFEGRVHLDATYPLALSMIGGGCVGLLVGNRAAYLFRDKDALQAAVLRVVARELDEAARVVVVPTARADDGLALSSRNVYLTDEQRAAAPVVHAALAAARDAWRAHHRSGGAAAGAGGAPRDELVAAARAALDAEPLVTAVDYVSVADYDTMGEIDRVPARAEGGGADPVAVVSVALRMGEVRLIDNIVLDSA